MEQRWAMPTCPIAVPVAHDATSFSATTRRIVEPVVAYSAVVRNKCETWLRRQHTDPIPPTEIALLECGSPSAGKFALVHLEQRMSVTVNSNGPSFNLQSTWVTTCVQHAFDEAREVELSTQAGLMASYLDVGGYIHHRNAQSELTFLQSKMRRAKAEAEVYTLALENSLASTYSDSDSSSSSSPRPTLPQHPPEEVRRYMECIDVESINSRSDIDDLW